MIRSGHGLVWMTVATLWACGGSTEDEGLDEALASEAQAHYAAVVLATYEDSLSEAKKLSQAIDAFLDEPSEQGLADARKAWKAAREPYLQSEAFRFYDGPIDDAEGPEGLLNAWPLDENYIDYVDGDEDAGLINDPSVPIDADTLMDRNERGGEKNIATGYHAIEFLLWGQDLNEDGPGDRPYTDFVDGGTADNQDRRRDYLKTVSDLLVSHLEELVDAWQANKDNYRADFEATAPKEAMRRILTGLTILSGFETGGERLQAALDTGLQEDEHSCFSDNTHRDMIQDIRGIQNVFLGRYAPIEGTTLKGASVYDVIKHSDAELADAIRTQIDQSLDLAESLHTPFDQEIRPDNKEGVARVEALIQSLQEQASSLEEVFPLYELSVEIPE